MELVDYKHIEKLSKFRDFENLPGDEKFLHFSFYYNKTCIYDPNI